MQISFQCTFGTTVASNEFRSMYRVYVFTSSGGKHQVVESLGGFTVADRVLAGADVFEFFN